MLHRALLDPGGTQTRALARMNLALRLSTPPCFLILGSSNSLPHHNVIHHRAGRTTEPAKIPSDVPLFDQNNINIELIVIIYTVSRATCPRIMPKRSTHATLAWCLFASSSWQLSQQSWINIIIDLR